MKTSITIDEELWERFDVELRRRWRERSYSRGLERLIKEWLEGDGISQVIAAHQLGPTDPAITPDTRHPEQRRMVAAVLAAMRDPELCPIHLPVLKALLAEELRKIPKGKHRAEEKEGAA